MPKQQKISEITRSILALADTIPGYGQERLLTDLAVRFGTMRFLTMKEVADMLHVSPQTVMFWRKKGILQASLVIQGKNGGTGSVRYSMEDVSDFITAQRRTAPAALEGDEEL